MALLAISMPARTQTAIEVGGATNTGTSSWGVSDFKVTGTYNAAAGATDHFYNAGGQQWLYHIWQYGARFCQPGNLLYRVLL